MLNMDSDEEIRSVMHSYAKKIIGIQFWQLGSRYNITPLPGSPDLHPPKKVRPCSENPEAPTAMHAVLLHIEKMQEESLRRLTSVEAAVNDNSSSIRNLADSLESMNKQIDAVADKVESDDNRVIKLEKENASLCDKYEELDSYKRRWNLRVVGVEEQPDENTKQLIISLFGEISPDIADQLPNSIDTVHKADNCAVCPMISSR